MNHRSTSAHNGSASGWRRLSVGVIGGGIGGMSTAISLRRAGHDVTVYERNDFAGEVGASVSCAANGTRWLHEWKVDLAKGDGVILKRLINRDWKTGEPVSVYELDDYEEKWGYVYYMFHRQYMHSMLKDCAFDEAGEGPVPVLKVNHACITINTETGTIAFSNGKTATHDLVIGADGIGSVARRAIGLNPEKRPSDSSCLHANVTTEEARALGLVDYSLDEALEYWGGQEGKWDKIVLSPCNGGNLLSYYCFFSRSAGDYTSQTWGGENRPVEELLAPYPELDQQVKSHLAIGKEIQPWRLWVHEPYPFITKRTVALLGDAAHPMMPHQSQGACMAIEDAAALGIIFSRKHFRGDLSECLAVYEQVRLPRATRVQAAAAKAASNINERIVPGAGFSSNTNTATYKVEDETKKLTIEEMNAYDMYKDIEEVFSKRRQTEFVPQFIRGLPVGLKLPSGIVIGASA
ncbi:hypothetical protein MCOR27_000975 [Pyricularia oryzae]|nr:hypothetical protein MCOR26_003060 [Pyricularia oryzae]KAI6288302.1 hypothetical protein MCOR27_000975 [Pyricularia oryzae]KAI6320258.1 hypothetical protein MCOR30_008314 [Pyricularia oryzae]KAI6399776.1 hypothetical protein MCOR23_005082 [Pyricularia oryzae]KAI6431855.1 hypothetical protein MCOR21_003716 [Pyricularia oryzae]